MTNPDLGPLPATSEIREQKTQIGSTEAAQKAFILCPLYLVMPIGNDK